MNLKQQTLSARVDCTKKHRSLWANHSVWETSRRKRWAFQLCLKSSFILLWFSLNLSFPSIHQASMEIAASSFPDCQPRSPWQCRNHLCREMHICLPQSFKYLLPLECIPAWFVQGTTVHQHVDGNWISQWFISHKTLVARIRAV